MFGIIKKIGPCGNRAFSKDLGQFIRKIIHAASSLALKIYTVTGVFIYFGKFRIT